MARDPIVAAILEGSRRRGLDPHAVLAVASVEGGFRGAIGDQGTSFGPFQLHRGGALPAGRGHNWANSQAGINYALDRIASVARGKRGRSAIEAIVRQFERPAAPGQEVAKAFGRYGKVGGGTGALSSPLSARGTSSPPVAPAADLTGLFNLTREIVGLPESHISFAPPTATPPPRAPQARQQAVDMGGPGFKFKRGKTINQIEAFAKPFGVQITSTTHGNHVRGSYHYRGRAVDFGGDAGRMAALARAALQHPQDWAEMFYTGPGHPGFFIKDGKAHPLSQLNQADYDHHTDHVHIAR